MNQPAPPGITADDVARLQEAVTAMGEHFAAVLRSAWEALGPVLTEAYRAFQQVHDADPDAFHTAVGAPCTFCTTVAVTAAGR